MNILPTLFILPALLGIPLSTQEAPDAYKDGNIATVETLAGENLNSGEVVYEGENASITVAQSDEKVSATARANKVITCTLTVDNPHGSTHVKGTINVVAKLNCKGGNFARADLQTSLIRISPNKQWGAPLKTEWNKNYTQNNASTACHTNILDYKGWARAEIIAPAGYVPSTATIAKYGNKTPVKCGLMKSAPAVDTPAEVITIEFVSAS